MKTSVLRVLGGVVAAGALVGLAGCTPRHDVSFGYVDGVLQFVSCERVEANQIRVAVRDFQGDWYTLWIGEGDVRGGQGNEITVLEPDSGLDLGEHNPERVEGAERVSVELIPLTGLGELGDPVGANVSIADIPPSGWLRNDGHVSDSPCSG